MLVKGHVSCPFVPYNLGKEKLREDINTINSNLAQIKTIRVELKYLNTYYCQATIDMPENSIAFATLYATNGQVSLDDIIQIRVTNGVITATSNGKFNSDSAVYVNVLIVPDNWHR